MSAPPGDAEREDDRALDDRAQDDRRLLAEHVAGDPEAFGVLFARHRDRLWAVALRTTGDPEVAADALQDAMVSAFRRAETFRGDARVTTWLHRVVVNACLDRLRRTAVRLAEPLPDDLDREVSRGAAVQSPAADHPETVAERHDLRRRVLAALGELPVDQRAALVLVDLEGLSVQEAAEVLECPTGTIKSRCARGRARLAVLLVDLREPAAGVVATKPAGTGPASGPSERRQGPAPPRLSRAPSGPSDPSDPSGPTTPSRPSSSKEVIEP